MKVLLLLSDDAMNSETVLNAVLAEAAKRGLTSPKLLTRIGVISGDAPSLESMNGIPGVKLVEISAERRAI